MKRAGGIEAQPLPVKLERKGHLPTQEEVADEARRMSRLRAIVDVTSTLIMQSGFRRREAEALVDFAREKVLELFPGREETFEIVYARRFGRLIDEFTRPDSATVVPFPVGD